MKKDGHAVGWCSDTEAMIGMYLWKTLSDDIRLCGLNHRLFSVASVPQRIKSSGPWCDPPFIRETNDGQRTEDTSCDYGSEQELLELLGRHMRPNEFHERDNLQKTEDT